MTPRARRRAPRSVRAFVAGLPRARVGGPSLWRSRHRLWSVPTSLPLHCAFGANYGFLCRKPDQPTLMDLLGPWPWYLLGREVAARVLSWVFLVPFQV